MRMKLENLLGLRCPVCGKGKIFHGYLDTPVSCPECGFYFMRETGYFLPHAPISYLLIVLAAVLVWAVLRLAFRVESDTMVLSSMVVFAVAFGVLVAFNSLVALPKPVLNVAGELSRFALVVAIAAIGMRTSLKELTVLGLKPVLLMVAETLFLAGIIVGMMKFLAT